MLEFKKNTEKFPKKVDVIHICIPYQLQENFVNSVIDYYKEISTKLLIIHSTIPPKTTFKIAENCNCLVSHPRKFFLSSQGLRRPSPSTFVL